MYIFNGKKLTEEQAKKFAEETGRDLQAFLEANPDIQEDPDFGPQDELGKPGVAVEEGAAAVTGDTALQLDFGLLELPNAKSKTKDSTLILSEKSKEEKNEIYKSFKSVRKNIVKSLPGLAEADKENKEKRFSKGSVKNDEIEEYKNWKETGEVSYDESIFSKENVDQLVANGERELLENVSNEDREVMLSEKEAYLKPIVKARDEGYIMINDNVKAIKQIKANFELSEEMGTPYTEDQRLAAIAQIKELSGSVDEMYATYLTNSALIDDESEFLDAFRRSYSNIDQLANITKTVVTDMGIGVMATMDMLKDEEGKKKSFTNNLVGYREELQEIANTKLPKPIPVSSIRNFDDMTNWGTDAVVNFVPSGVMAFSGPAAMPLFFASGYGSRMSEFELNKKQAEEAIPELEKQLANTQDPNEISRIQDEIDKQNQVLSISDLNKFLVAGIYGTAEVVTEKLTTLRLVDDLKNANTVFQTKGFGKALVEKIKEFPTGPLLEGGGEGVNAVVGNWADITILGQDKSYLEGVDEAMAQGALIGTGFKVAETGMLGKAAMLDVISDNNDKKVLKTLVDEVNQLTSDLNKVESLTERGEILRAIRNKVKNTIIEQDFTGTQFLKLTQKEQQEVFESDRKARKVNKRWAAIASSGVNEKAKEIIRKELEAEYNSHQDNKTVVLRKSDSNLKELAKVEGLKSGDFNRKYKIYTVNDGAVKRNNKLRSFANKIIGVTESEIEAIQDFASSEEVLITLSDKSVLNQKDAAEILKTWNNGATGAFSPFTKNIYSFVERSTSGNPSTVLHEYFHAMALAKGFTQAQYASLKDDYIEMLNSKVKDKSITESQKEDILARYLQEYDGSIDAAEELINLTADAVNLDILKEDDVTFLQKFATNVKSIIGTILSKEEADNYSINTAEDAWNMVQTFSQNVLSKKEGPTVVNIGEPVEGQEEGIKESRSTVLEAINELVPTDVTTKQEFQSRKVFKPIYESVIEKGGAINNYIRSRTTSKQEAEKAIESVSDRLLNFDPAAVRKAGEAVGTEAFGEFIFANTNFGKLDAKKELFKESEKTKQEVPLDAPEATTQLADEVSVDETKVKSTTSKLRRVLGIKQGDKIYNLAKKVSEKIMTGDLPGKKVKTAVNKEARKSELRKAVSNLMGTEKAIDEQFLNKNILEVLKALPASDLVKLEREAKVKVLAEQGSRLSVKEAREAVNKGLLPKDTNLQSGPKLSTKLPTTLEQAKKFFTQKRKQGLVNVITEMLVKDAAPEVTEGKVEPAKRAKVLSEIDRAPTLKFSKSINSLEGKNQSNFFNKLPVTVEQIKALDLSIPNKSVLDKIQNILKDNLGQKFPKTKEISKDLFKVLSLYNKIDKQFKNANTALPITLEEMLFDSLKASEENTNLLKFLKIKGNLSNYYTVENINRQRQIPVEIATKMLSEGKSKEEVIKFLTLAKGMYASSSKIGKGNFKVVDGLVVEVFEGDQDYSFGSQRYQVFDSVKDYEDNVINQITGLKPTKIKLFPDTSKAAISDKNYEGRLDQAKDFRDVVDTIMLYMTDGIIDSDLPYTKIDLALVMAAMKSNMSAPLKKAANLKWIFEGGNVDVKDLRYEHLIPTNYMMLNLLDVYLNNKGSERTKKANELFKEYTVAVIPRSMDDTITDVGLQDVMNSDYKTGEDPISRYYNLRTFGNEFMFALKSINPKDNGKIVGQEWANISKDKAIAAEKNNVNLPAKDRLSQNTEYTNKDVLDKTKEIDKESLVSEMKFSKSLNLSRDFNDIIENKTGIASDKTYARVKAEVAGANKGRFNFFIPPSAEDFVGLLYSTLGKGDVGTAQMAWYKAHLLNPFARAMENLANDRVSMMQDYRGLKKALKIVPKDLRKKIKDSNFTKEQAVRVFIWDKQGMSVPGLSQKDQKELVDYVNADAELTVFAEQLVDINKGDEYVSPDAGWVAGTIDTDFIKALNTTKRSKYLETWQQNADIIFSEANLNKLEAAYGKPYRVALENMLHRMKTGRNRSFGTDTITSRFTDWLTNSVGAIMFFNTRSAVLQTISAVNFINFTDNNVLKAGLAFANQPQYWKDFIKLFNSPFLLDRRSGIKLNVNEADIAEMAKGPGNSARNVVAGLLKLGFLPTQIADSFAIASGGATFYRNRIKALKKEGLTEAEAEEIAFRDFREIAEESQQSSRPDKISQQQAGPLGRVVLAFANTPAQYARLIKKAASDLKNGRGDAKTNISKIIYYGVAQNLLFSALQQALFAIGFGDEEEEEEKRNEKYFNIANGMADSILRGIGVGGAIVSVVKNTAIRLAKEADKKAPKYQDAVVKGVLQISPPVSSKVSKLQSAGRSFSWNQKEMKTMGFNIDNPAYLASAQVISAITNVPLDRAIKKITNIKDAGDENIEYYKRVALALGWSAWELGIKKDSKGKVKKVEPKTDMDKLYDLNKKQQIDSLLSLGLSKKQIKALKLEEDRVKAILNPKSVKKIKVSKKDSLFGLNKKDQVKALEKLGLTKKEIRALRLESDRVEAIINKQKQEN